MISASFPGEWSIHYIGQTYLFCKARKDSLPALPDGREAKNGRIPAAGGGEQPMKPFAESPPEEGSSFDGFVFG
jgi:hypothetical protein